jgi:DNA-binding MarR family transcriptional regulator
MTDLEAIGKACFALHARMTARILSRAYDAALRPLGLSLPQFSVLGVIGHGTTLSETALADRLGLERTTLVRNLKVLEEKRWIEPVPAEGRGLQHRLTPEGRDVLAAAIPLWCQVQDDLEGRMTDVDPESARQALRALRRAAYKR